jgi:hypothetical protein
MLLFVHPVMTKGREREGECEKLISTLFTFAIKNARYELSFFVHLHSVRVMIIIMNTYTNSIF